MGEYSGYDVLYRYICDVWRGNVKSVFATRDIDFLKRRTQFFLSWCSSRINKLPFYNYHSMLAEINALYKLLLGTGQLMHTMYLENNYGLLAHLKNRLSAKVIGTSHQPPSWWRMLHRNPNMISSLDALIVLSSDQKNYFEEFLPGRVRFIRHGVDTEYFKPLCSDDKNDSPDVPHCIFCGHWLRDIQALRVVIDEVLKKNSRIIFDIIFSKDRIANPEFYRIARHNQVRWHSDVSDDTLRELYQQATLLFLPLIDCAANNALLESTACGLPIVTTDIAGVRDYTSESFAEYYDLEDVEGMGDAIVNLVNDKSEQKRRRSAARDYAEENLDWRIIVHQTIELYKNTL